MVRKDEHDMICYDMGWYYMTWYDMKWYDMIWHEMIRYDMIWYDMLWYDMIWYEMTWNDMIWYDMIWYYMIWYDMIWYDMILNEMTTCDMIWFDVTWCDMKWQPYCNVSIQRRWGWVALWFCIPCPANTPRTLRFSGANYGGMALKDMISNVSSGCSGLDFVNWKYTKRFRIFAKVSTHATRIRLRRKRRPRQTIQLKTQSSSAERHQNPLWTLLQRVSSIDIINVGLHPAVYANTVLFVAALQQKTNMAARANSTDK